MKINVTLEQLSTGKKIKRNIILNSDSAEQEVEKLRIAFANKGIVMRKVVYLTVGSIEDRWTSDSIAKGIL